MTMETILKTLGKAFGLLFKLTLILLIAAILLPIGWFVLRAGQPMDLPQFKGLSYYQYLQWRQMAYRQMAVDYQTAHPDYPMNGGLDMCLKTEVGVSLAYAFPVSGIFTLSGKYPSLQRFLDQRGIQAPTGVAWANFLPLWWQTYEKFVWSAADYAPHGPVVRCRLKPIVPTPQEFETLSQQSLLVADP